MTNALTVDVEDWYHGNDLNISIDNWDDLEDRVEYSTNNLLEVFSRYNVRGTFFVLGHVAQKHPNLIKSIDNAGHEIGSHGRWHGMVSKQTREDFRKELLWSKNLLESITGKGVKYFRAPSWSLSSDTLWALQVLEEEGFTGDSSIYPCKTPLYGIDGAPITPYHPVIDGRKLNLVEFPPTVLQIGKYRLPFAGGLYLRILPCWFIIRALAKVNRERLGMVYTHPWETDTGQPRLKVSPIIKLVHYLNLHSTRGKLEKIITNFNFAPLGELLKGEFPAYQICGK